jgi:GNAT superfamily N-acetyltransferase
MLKAREASSTEPDLVGPVSHVLAEAFRADPWVGYIMAPALDTDSIAMLFEPMVRAALRFGTVVVTEPTLTGAAVALAPGKWDLSAEELTAAGFDELDAKISPESSGRFARHGEDMQRIHRQDAPNPHWYLELLGVVASQRRRGLGAMLLEPILARADSARTPTYLETSNEDNVAFYADRGFALVRHGVNLMSSVPYWTMLRPPR